MDNQNRKLELLGNAPNPKSPFSYGYSNNDWYAHQRLYTISLTPIS